MSHNRIQLYLVNINLGDEVRPNRGDDVEQTDVLSERLNQQRRVVVYHKRSGVCQ